LIRESFGAGDVTRLAALVAAAQQKQQALAAPREIYAVTRAMIDPQLIDATTKGFRVTE
jgi:hypothetical protein